MPPDVSVVVPTHNRPEGLRRLLEALDAQTLSRSRFEVIVVDDGSHPAQEPAAGVKLIRHEQALGPGAARNTGWRAASAPLVAFTDDDCTPSPTWLAGVSDAAGGEDRAIVQGPVRPPPGQERRVHPLAHAIVVTGPDSLYATCNVAYSHALLDSLGGFDAETFRRSAEDVDLGARAVKAGAVVRYSEDALVYHEVTERTLQEHLRHARKWTDSVGAVARHPELRDLLVARMFWKPSHPRVLLAALGMLTRRPLLALPYLWYYRRLYHGQSLATARALSRHLVIDLCEVATVLEGSVRHRTLML